jgi:hypothetical protein
MQEVHLIRNPEQVLLRDPDILCKPTVHAGAEIGIIDALGIIAGLTRYTLFTGYQGIDNHTLTGCKTTSYKRFLNNTGELMPHDERIMIGPTTEAPVDIRGADAGCPHPYEHILFGALLGHGDICIFEYAVFL